MQVTFIIIFSSFPIDSLVIGELLLFINIILSNFINYSYYYINDKYYYLHVRNLFSFYSVNVIINDYSS